MSANQLNEKLKAAGEKYRKGYTCSQAVFCAYARDMEIEPETACRMMEGFGGGMGGLQEVCGALSAVCAIVSYYASDASADLQKRNRIYAKVQKAANLFRREYGGVTCREVMHGNAPQAFQCGMKVKDAVMIVEQLIHENNTV